MVLQEDLSAQGDTDGVEEGMKMRGVVFEGGELGGEGWWRGGGIGGGVEGGGGCRVGEEGGWGGEGFDSEAGGEEERRNILFKS